MVDPFLKEGAAMSLIIALFLCGDVMLGRGIDQALPHPGNPAIYESYMKSARGYLELAEQANGPIPVPVDFSYIWGDALGVLKRMTPDLRVINLETTVTRSNDYWKGKGINYRMNPKNIPVITAAGIDFCSLGNNHILDWGYEGLAETLETLRRAGVKHAGAGRDLKEAQAPAVMVVEGKGRVIAFSFGSLTSGIHPSWAASESRPGVNMIEDFSEEEVERIRELVGAVKNRGDIVVASIHWGGNWGYQVPDAHRAFAHRLIDSAGVDIIHGHSSHHVKGIEVYRGRLILYGSGDFINDYEGISGYEHFRGDLSLMYFAGVDPSTGKLVHLRMVPTQMMRFRVNRASQEDAEWLRDILNREGRRFGTRVELDKEGILSLKWVEHP